MERLLIIADDFTGALDTGVKLSSYDAKTRVYMGTSAFFENDISDVQVMVIDANTRHLSAKEAYRTVFDIVSHARSIGIEYIYKKTDSALRGNIGAELCALMDAAKEEKLAFIPAYPEMKRCTVNGVHYIEGVPVSESVFAKDPFEPVLHSKVADIINLQTDKKVNRVAFDAPSPDKKGINVFDATANIHLRHAGKSLKDKGELGISAGCAGFADILPEFIKIERNTDYADYDVSKKLVVICGSVNQITLAQLDKAENVGFKRLRLTPELKLNKNYINSRSAADIVDHIVNAAENYSYIIVDSNDAADNIPTKELAEERNLSQEFIRENISDVLGYITAGLCLRSDDITLVITGGDTLLKCMKAMNVESLEPVRELLPGVVLSRFSFRGNSRYVISKSGGFGNDRLLVDLKNKLIR
ncbi:MAG: four-carbon acid sugar kinase family protein [Christensenellaceae bacterium]|nr:four-carbon acid sugar kinase family protein [Christensenellaceae bacterium]